MRGRYAGRRWGNRNLRVRFEITVPFDIDLDIETAGGSLQIADIDSDHAVRVGTYLPESPLLESTLQRVVRNQKQRHERQHDHYTIGGSESSHDSILAHFPSRSKANPGTRPNPGCWNRDEIGRECR